MGPAAERRVGLGDFPSHGFAFRHIARAFAEAVDGRGAMIATGADGLRALEAMIAAYVSAATGRTISLPLDRASPPFKLGAMGVPEIEQAAWSPFNGSKLFRRA
jgi:hypothetical protein